MGDIDNFSILDTSSAKTSKRPIIEAGAAGRYAASQVEVLINVHPFSGDRKDKHEEK